MLIDFLIYYTGSYLAFFVVVVLLIGTLGRAIILFSGTLFYKEGAMFKFIDVYTAISSMIVVWTSVADIIIT